MAMGPGKYDKECTEIRSRIKADGIIMIVFGGEKGNGFSAQLPLHLTLSMPEILRKVASDIEKSGSRA